MSSVPPNIVGPILQSNLAQRQVSGVRDNERAQQTNADQKQSAAINEKDSTVETTDNDTEVYADAEGQGSQGRAFTEPDQDEEEQQPEDDSPDADQGQHIDFQA